MGRTIEFRKNATGLVENIVVRKPGATTDQDAIIMKYGYAWYPWGHALTSVTDPLGTATQTEAGHVTRYEYDNAVAFLLRKAIYPTGGSTEYTYLASLQPKVNTDDPSYYWYAVQRQKISAAQSAFTPGDRINTWTYTWIPYPDSTSTNLRVSSSAVEIAETETSPKLQRTEYTFGAWSAFSERYDPFACTAKTVKDGAGNVLVRTEYKYDRFGEIIEEKTAMGNTTTPRLVTNTSNYDYWGNLKYSKRAFTDASGKEVSHETFFAYANGGVPVDPKSAVDGGAYNTEGFLGNTLGFSNNFYPNSVASFIHDRLTGKAEIQNDLGTIKVETYIKYDASGNPLESRQRLDTPSGISWVTTGFMPDIYGNMVSVVDPRSYEARFTYGPTIGTTNYNAYLMETRKTFGGSPVMVDGTPRQPVTVIQKSDYDLNTGWRISQSLTATDSAGNLLVPETRYRHDFAYDKNGRLTKVTYPLITGQTVRAQRTVEYNDAQNTATLTYEKGSKVKQVYDGLGRLVREETFRNATEYASGTPYLVKTMTYNWQDKVASETVNDGSKTYLTKYEYDPLGRLRLVTLPDAKTREYQYDDIARTLTVFDENRNKKVNQYDLFGRMIAVKEYPGTAQLPRADEYVTSYQYDRLGNLVKVTDARGKVTIFSYDNLNRLVETQYTDSSRVSKGYDAAGNLVNRTDQSWKVTAYEYDESNRLRKVTYGHDSTKVITHYYDLLGNRSRTEGASFILAQSGRPERRIDYVYAYKYDERNRLIEAANTIGARTYKTTYSYNEAGNLTSITSPDGKVTYIKPDELGRVTAVARSADFLDKFASFAYYPLGKVKDVDFANGVVASYAYDDRQRPSAVTVNKGAASLVGWNYGYDGVGNVTSINNESFEYDGLDRLITWRRN
ncbi:MAG: hypothetical protein ACM3TT_06380 [Syntrophothermus sp.]